MKINIAGEEIMLTVPYSDQIYTRDTESDVNRLFDTWRKRFPEKSDRELLAMIAFQYATHYNDLLRQYKNASEAAAELENQVEIRMNAQSQA